MSFMDDIKKLNELDVSTLDFESMGVWPAPVKAVILVLVIVIAFALAYFLKVKDISNQMEFEKAEEQRLLADYTSKAYEAANLEKYQEQAKELDKSFNAMLAQLPKDTEVPDLLEDISELAFGSSLDVQAISLQPEAVQEYYIELPIKISARGGYHDLASFVSGVSSLSRIVTLHDFSLSGNDKSNSINFEVTAKTYRYKPTEDLQ